MDDAVIFTKERDKKVSIPEGIFVKSMCLPSTKLYTVARALCESLLVVLRDVNKPASPVAHNDPLSLRPVFTSRYIRHNL